MRSMRSLLAPGPARLLLAAALTLGCSDALDGGQAPVVDALRPARAAPGGSVTLVGRRFGLQGPLDAVYLGGTPATVEDWDDRAIRLAVPADGRHGQVAVVVKTEGLISAPVWLEIVDPGGDGAVDGGPTDAGVDGGADGALDGG